MPNNGSDQRANSVGLAGDGDDVELLDEFEAVFQISFSDVEDEGIATLGDALELVCSKLPPVPERQGKCRTAMAYYRLKAGLQGKMLLSPRTRVTVPDSETAISFQKHLEETSGFRLGFLTAESTWATILFWFQFVSWIAAPVFLDGSNEVVGMLAIALASHLLWRVADYADDGVWVFNGTLGDLSRHVSEKNFGNLVSCGGAWKESEVWKTMTGIIQEHTGFPADRMRPEMRFI